MNQELKEYVEDLKKTADFERLMLTKKVTLDGMNQLLELLNNPDCTDIKPQDYIEHLIDKVKGI